MPTTVITILTSIWYQVLISVCLLLLPMNLTSATTLYSPIPSTNPPLVTAPFALPNATSTLQPGSMEPLMSGHNPGPGSQLSRTAILSSTSVVRPANRSESATTESRLSLTAMTSFANPVILTNRSTSTMYGSPPWTATFSATNSMILVNHSRSISSLNQSSWTATSSVTGSVASTNHTVSTMSYLISPQSTMTSSMTSNISQGLSSPTISSQNLYSTESPRTWINGSSSKTVTSSRSNGNFSIPGSQVSVTSRSRRSGSLGTGSSVQSTRASVQNTRALLSGVPNSTVTAFDSTRTDQSSTTLSQRLTATTAATLPSAALNSTISISSYHLSSNTSISIPTASSLSVMEPEDGMNPPWNLRNITCADLALLNGTQQWAAVDGDSMIQIFSDIYGNNSLVCTECFGMKKGTCKSKDPRCQNGLRDLATLPGSDGPRWDTAAAHFAQDPDITDLRCELGNTECLAAPVCLSCNGPGSFLLLKSLQTMYDTLQTLYSALSEARDRATDQQTLFQTVFAPVPSIKGAAIGLGIFFAVLLAGVGLLAAPELELSVAVTSAAVLTTSLASSVSLDEFFFGQSGPPDTESVLGEIVNATQNTYARVVDSLFMNGNYTLRTADGKKRTESTLLRSLRGGFLVQASANKSTAFENLVPRYERVIYQQLAYYTWQNLESDHVNHIPFIVFDNKPCDQIGVNDPLEGSIAGVIDKVRTSDTNVTFDGKCYYLLDARPIGNPIVGQPPLSPNCRATDTLPGGTNKQMTENANDFGGLSLGDFSIPSVKGYNRNDGQNNYPKASDNGQLVSDPQDVAAVNIPVCDYVGSPDSPGTGCPKINIPCARRTCATYPLSSGANQPGDFNPGWSGVHVQQWQRNEGDSINPLPNYQLSVLIYDANGIEIGQATKQSAVTTLKIVDCVLPYEFYVATGTSDSDPIQFWYGEQWWNSSGTTNQCAVGPYSGGSRNIDCGFEADEPSRVPPPDASIAHPFPNQPVAAIGGDKTFINTFMTASSSTLPTGGPLPPAPTPTYTTGFCGIHIHQYQINEPKTNPTGTYQIEVTLFSGHDAQGKTTVLGSSGKVPAPDGQPVNVTGLVSPVMITLGPTDDKPIVIAFAGDVFDTTAGQCKVGPYDQGGRDVDCGFTC